MADLTTTYLGLALRSPIVAAASPLTGNLDTLLHLEDAGAAAVVLPSLFEEQLIHDSVELAGLLDLGEAHPEAGEGAYLPSLDAYNTGAEHYLGLVQAAKQRLDIPVVANLNGMTPGGWPEYARELEAAGADAIELNVYGLATAADVTSADVEDAYVEIATTVHANVTVPVAVKLSPYVTAIPRLAGRLAEAGVAGLVLFNRLPHPDIDIESLEVVPHLRLSTSHELPLALRWVGILSGRVPTSLAISGGVHHVEDVVKGVLAGADVTMLASALLAQGPDLVRKLEEAFGDWLDDHEYESVEQMKGSVSQRCVPDPSVYERASYLRTLVRYSSPFRA